MTGVNQAMHENDGDGLTNYMGGPFLTMGLKYINSRASGLSCYFFERGIQLLCSWIPGPIGTIMRAVFYKPFFHQNSRISFLETNTELLYMNSIRFGKGVYVDRNCRLHASEAAIELGDNSRVMRGSYICTFVSDARKGEGVITGQNCWLGVNTVLQSGLGGIFMGNNVLIGPNVVIVTYQGEFQQCALTANLKLAHHGSPIYIGDNVIIYGNVVIAGGVTIGENSVIAAGAVVTKDVEPYTFAGGIPCRKLRDIAKNEATNVKKGFMSQQHI